MNWTRIYIDYKDTGIVGNCPKCGSKLDVDILNRSITFICPSCKSFRHFDEIKDQEETNERT